jgi:hypothetical protein
MDSDGASFADMRRPLTDPDADPLTLNEETVERLLTGDLPPWQVPPGYAQVAALLAATTVEPTPEELAGQSKVLAELRAVTRPRRAGAHIRRAARPARRRWAGLAAVALVGALVTGGVAVAATGMLPAPLRTVARSILGGAGGDLGQATPPRPDPQAAPDAAAPDDASSPASVGTAAGPKGPLAAGSAGPGSGPRQAGPVAEPDRERLCKAYLASQDKDRRKRMDAAAFKRLAEAAGGESRIPAYCHGTQPGDPRSEDEKQQPPEGQEQGQGGSSPGGGGGQGQGQPPTTQSSNR